MLQWPVHVITYVSKYIKYVSDSKQYDLWIVGDSDQ